MINVDNLKYTYPIRDDEGNVIGAKIALDNISFSIKKGEFVAILGHNGSGKSTLSKELNALLLPSEGDVRVSGMNTKDEAKTLEIRSDVGMVFQNPDNQIIASIVEEDVAFGPENMGFDTSKIRKRVDESLKTVGMSEYKKSSPTNLSGGQKQRIAIAGVLAMKPKCIVLDEPTAMLDPLGRKEVIDAAVKLNKEDNVTIILITHYMEEVVYADKIIVMDKGKIIDIGTPREIFSKVEMLEEKKLEVPIVTKVAYQLEKSGYKIKRGIITREELVNEIVKFR